MKILDLFAGAGGWDVAAQGLGHDVVGVENMPEALRTREANLLATLFEDVWTPLTPNTTAPWQQDAGYVARKMLSDFNPDMLIASPPCQTFSLAGHGKGRQALDDVLAAIDGYDTVYGWNAEDTDVHTATSAVLDSASRMRAAASSRGMDDRTTLVITPLVYADLLEPTYILLEQVPAVLPVWEKIAELLELRGYSVATGCVQAEQYGVPQTRRRAVLMARRDGEEAVLPAPTHSKYHNRTPERLDDGVLPWVSMAEALGFDTDNDVPVPAHLRSNYGTSGDKDNRGERTIEQPAPTITSKANRNHWVFRRPSTTIVGSFRPDIVAAPGYRKAGDGPRQNQPGSVQVTLEQAATLQSFPAGFEFVGSVNKRFLQVGNAVPPRLASVLIKAVTS